MPLSSERQCSGRYVFPTFARPPALLVRVRNLRMSGASEFRLRVLTLFDRYHRLLLFALGKFYNVGTMGVLPLWI